MKIVIENLDYPRLDTLPEFRDENEKLTRYRAAMNSAEREIARLQEKYREQLAGSHQRESRNRDAIEAADRLLTGGQLQSIAEQIEAQQRTRDAMNKACAAQEQVVSNLRRDLSIKAAERFNAEHKKRARRVIDALMELDAANASECALRASLEKLGYNCNLPCMGFGTVDNPIDPYDQSGGYASAWLRDALDYAGSEKQVNAHKARKEQQRTEQLAEYQRLNQIEQAAASQDRLLKSNAASARGTAPSPLNAESYSLATRL
ncbi:hypothetical protein [Paraburkholderia adhaesiva]|uniref:hypothetical protein n=1 Tax=Paraburkholderia adhaesiva TaxID=2883244 RepID=UPI001F1A3A0A|nr:hypothetical protein [Paraburkholderia adhaesiva]